MFTGERRRPEHEDGYEKHREYKSVSVNAPRSGHTWLKFPSQTQFSRRLAPQNLPDVLRFSVLLMQRKKHSVMFRKSGTIKSPPATARTCTFTSPIEFLVRQNYPRNMRETRDLFFLWKKKRAPFEGSLGTCTTDSPCSVKEKNRNADTTDPRDVENSTRHFFTFRACIG